MSAWKAGVWKTGVWQAGVWGCIGGLITIYNVARIYIMTRMGRSVQRSGKRSVVVDKPNHAVRIK